MARRRTRRRSYASAPRRRTVTRRIRSAAKGKASMKKVTNTLIDGMLVGAAQNFIPNDALMGYADDVVPIAVGWFRGNETLMTIGGYGLGVKLASQLTGNTKSTSIGGAY